MALYKLQQTNIIKDENNCIKSDDVILHLYLSKRQAEKYLFEYGELPKSLFKKIVLHPTSEC